MQYESQVIILLAAYNGEAFVREQIDSILKQSFSDWRLVLSDDNSQDDTKQILKEYADKYPEKIFFYESGQRFGNAQKHFMHLLKKYYEKAPYIMFCDQDDVWHQNKIEISFNKIKASDENGEIPALVHTDLKVVNEKLELMETSFSKYNKFKQDHNLKQLLVRNTVTGCTIIMNKKLASLMLIPTTFEETDYMHDYWAALVATTCGRIDYIEETTIDYRQHLSNSIGLAKRKSWIDCAICFFDKNVREVQKRRWRKSYNQALTLQKYLSKYINQNFETIIEEYSRCSRGGSMYRKVIIPLLGYRAFNYRMVISQVLLG